MLFHKPFKVKSNVLVKSSERKRIKTLILKTFPILTEEVLDKHFCKEIYTLKLELHSEETVHVYMAFRLPLIFDYDNRIYPSVYLTWICPDIIPTFTVYDPVLKFVKGGADVMLPGIIIKNPHNKKSYGNLIKGASVTVNLESNKAGVAIGQVARSSDDLYMSGGKGKAINVLHYWGDELCKISIEIDYPQLGKPDICKSPEELQQELEAQQVQDDVVDEITSNLNNQVLDENQSYAKACLGEDGSENIENEPKPDNSHENTPEFMDELYLYSFVKAIKLSNKKIELPMLASNFNKVHMIPACPCGYQLDIKKSTHKKMLNFLNFMAKEHEIIKLENNAGVLKIISIQYQHELLKNFVDKYQDSASQNQNNSNESKSKKKNVDVVENYNVTAAVLPLFSEFLCKKGDALHMRDIKKHIVDYVSKEKLQDPDNKTFVHLNDKLKVMILSKTTSDDIVLTYEQLIKEILAKMTQSFQVTLTNDQVAQHKGKLKPIDMQLATRSGNKKVTLINNLDIYGIDLKEFCKLCQHGVAASAGVNMVNNQPQVQVQGNQVLFVYNLLTEKYSIQKRFIRGLELAEKKKKK